jgi:hypothetical protein
MSRGVSKKNKEKLRLALEALKKANDTKPNDKKDRSNSTSTQAN